MSLETIDQDEIEMLNLLGEVSGRDYEILEVLEEGRNVPANIADRIDQEYSQYVSDRLQHLKDLGLVHKVGRDTVSLYELTGKGREALEVGQQVGHGK